jgi:ferritin-like metal-binding protein YciE
MKLTSLEKLYVEDLKDLYDAESRIVKALPKMAKAASASALRQGFETHLSQTEEHLERLKQIFGERGLPAKGKKCAAMEGLLEEGKELMGEEADPEVRDAGLIAAAQKVEHYEIASYGCVRTYAEILGEKEAARLLQKTLDEEKLTDEKLTQLAMSGINLDAAEAGEPRQPVATQKKRAS